MRGECGVPLPTREAVMSGRPETGPRLAMAERAEATTFGAVYATTSTGEAGPLHPVYAPCQAIQESNRSLNHHAIFDKFRAPKWRRRHYRNSGAPRLSLIDRFR